MIGRRLAHYEILAELGKGGMGEVYRARDTRLGRDVALKFLPDASSSDADRRKRFMREAQAIAALKHPNIVTIHSVEESDGTMFLIMELVEGATLAATIPDGGLALERFFEIAIPLADAVAGAHDQGITHRDLKPGNIMFDRDRRVKVLDFGLAKLFLPEALDQAQTMALGSDTAAGQILGTAAYMSPEQAEGKPVDHRSDIFSLGVILYEMATGERPFRGDTQISTISSILKDTPRLVSDVRRQLPRHLGRIVSHCLEKSPDSRYQSAKDVRNELVGLKREVDSGDLTAMREGLAVPLDAHRARPRRRWPLAAGAVLIVAAAVWWVLGRTGGNGPEPPAEPVSAAPETAPDPGALLVAPEHKMVVVLPFENLGNPDDAYFAAGMTDEITSRISAVAEIGVISRSSATSYDRTGKTMRQIGADLGVDYVLEGTVRWAGGGTTGRVRISPKLIRVADDTQIWAQTYDRDIEDVFEVQSEIANRMVTELGVTLTRSEQKLLADAPTQNIEAYKLFLRAEEVYREDFMHSDSLYTALMHQVVELDPEFVTAWAHLASFHLDFYAVFDKTDERLARATRALRRAEALDPEHTETRMARGSYYYYGFHEYEHALREFEAAAQRAPSHALARLQIGNIHRRLGNWERCVENQKMAVLLDPRNVNNAMQLAFTYAGLRRFEEAAACMRPLLEVGDNNAYWVAMELSNVLMAWKGDLGGYRDLMRGDPRAFFLRAQYHIYSGDYVQALEVIDATPELPIRGFESERKLWSAFCHLRLQGSEAAAAALEEATRSFEADLDEAPDDAWLRSQLAIALALSGNHDAAIREARLAMEQESQDRFFGVERKESLAMVYALVGQQEAALDLIEELLGTTYSHPLTPHVLQLDPVWYRLHDNPRFRTLLPDET